jgi:hypothetical protein
VFVVDGVEFRWSDVVRAAAVTGALDREVGLTAARLAAERRAGGDVTRAEVSELGEAFRRERGLLTADSLDAWLDACSLTRSDWQAFLRRETARRRVADADQPSAAAEDAALSGALRVDLLCSGVLDHEAWALAVDAGLSGDAPDGDVARIVGAAEAVRAAAVTDAAVDRQIALHLLDWIWLAYDRVRFGDRDAAREAALCVRRGELSIGEVAAEAQRPVERIEVLLEDADPALRPALTSARAGEVIGPEADADGVCVCVVVERIAATHGLAVVRRRAEQALTAALEAHAAGRIRWARHG